MRRELLAEATRALREFPDEVRCRGFESAELGEENDRAAETRARVLGTVRRRRARRLALIKTTLPLAAVLVASAAWASSTGRLQSSLSWLTAAVAPEAASPAAPARAALEPVRERVAAAGRATVAEIEVGEVAEVGEVGEPQELPALPAALPSRDPAPVTSSRVASPPPAARPLLPPSAPSGAPAAPPADGEEARALYASAHQAHFGSKSYGPALAAWDAYLAAAPRGRFATEARYNRAICLARLGRAAEARAALEPFARGSGYRQREAQALLDALGAP